MSIIRHASRRPEATDPWLAGPLARKPKKAVAVATRQQDGTDSLRAGHEGEEIYRSRAAT